MDVCVCVCVKQPLPLPVRIVALTSAGTCTGASKLWAAVVVVARAALEVVLVVAVMGLYG